MVSMEDLILISMSLQRSMHFNNMIPGDTIDLRVTVENTNAIGAEDMTIDIMLNNIRSTDTEIEYDLTDFFYIYAGIITVTWYDNLADYMSNTPLQVQQITLNRFNQDQWIFGTS
jgi:hypothetical protein